MVFRSNVARFDGGLRSAGFRHRRAARRVRLVVCFAALLSVGVSIGPQSGIGDDADDDSGDVAIAVDEVDARAPRDPVDRRLVDRLDYFLSREQWDDAYQLAVHLLAERRAPRLAAAEPGETEPTGTVARGLPYLARTESGNYVPLPRLVLQKMQAMPPRFRERFRQDFAPLAERWLRTALETRDWELLEHVAERFGPLPAGQRAAGVLILVYADAGDLALAGYWVHRLLEHDSDVLRSPGVRQAAVAALRWLGEDEAAERLDASSNAPDQAATAVSAADRSGDETEPRSRLQPEAERRVTKPRSSASGRDAPPSESADAGPTAAREASAAKPAARSGVAATVEAAADDPAGRRPFRQLPFGGVDGNDLAAEVGVPVLVPRWSVVTARTETARRLLEELHRAVQGGSATVFPAWMPVFAGHLLAVPTLDGVVVLDRETGRRLYDLRDEVPAEAIINGHRLVHVGGLPAWLGAAPGTPASARLASASRSPMNHPVSFFAWVNTVHSSIAFDPTGQRLFWIRRHAVLLGQRVIASGQQPADAADSYQRDYDSNQLACLDAATGRTQWVVGGPADAERLAGHLAGTCFLGPPVVVGRRAYVIGEKNLQLRLFELDATTGVLRWSVVLAQTPVSIGNDMTRRLLALRPAVHGGMVICPTYLGYVTAVNPRTRRVLWVTRTVRMSAESVNYGRGGPAATLTPETPGSEWLHARPLAAGGRVLVTPQEGNVKPISMVDGRIVSYQTTRRALCLRLVDGEILWQRNKDNAVSVAGITGNTVLVHERQALVGWDMRSGKTVWSTGDAFSSRRPAGRGIVTPDRFAMPMADGAVLLGRRHGADVRVIQPPSVVAEPLGNLVAVGDLWISVLPWRVDAFELAGSLEAESGAARPTKRGSPEQRLRRAALLLSAGRWRETVEQIRLLESTELTPEQRVRRDRILRVALERLVLDDPAAHRAEAAQLERLLQAEGETVRLIRLQVERLLAEGRSLEAWERLLEAQARWVGPSRPLTSETVVQSQTWVWRPEAWAEARARELWRKFTSPERTTALERLGSTLQAAASAEDRIALARRFWFAGPAQQTLKKHIDDLIAQERLGEAEAEVAWLGAVLADTPAWLSEQSRHVAQALEEKHHRRMASAQGDAGGAKRQGGDVHAATQSEAAAVPHWDWSGGKPQVEMRYGGYRPAVGSYFLPVLAEPGTYFDRHAAFSFMSNSRYVGSSGLVLRVVDLVHERAEWTRVLARPAWARSATQSADVAATGHRLLCYANQMLRCLCVPEQRELWAVPIESPQLDTTHSRVQHEVVPLQPLTAAWFAGGGARPSALRQFAWLMDAGPVVIVTAEPQGIVGRDSRTGDIRWTVRIRGEHMICACWQDRVYLQYVPGGESNASATPGAAGQQSSGTSGDSRAAFTRVLVLDAATGLPLVAPLRVPFGAMVGRSRHLLTVGTPVADRIGAVPVVEPADRKTTTNPDAGKDVAPPSARTPQPTTVPAESEAQPMGDASGAVVRLWDPVTGTVAWSREVAADGKLLARDRRLVVIADARRGVDVVDLTAGTSVRLPDSVRIPWLGSEIWVGADARRLYVFPNDPQGEKRRGMTEFSESRPIGGTILAFDLKDGKPAWRYDGAPTWLPLRTPSISPVLVLARRETRTEHGVSYILRTIEMIDKRTGERVWEQTKPVNGVPNLQGITLDLVDRWIELWSYRERIRVSPRAAP